METVRFIPILLSHAQINNRNFTLDLVGKGYRENYLKKLVKKLDLVGQVNFHGQVEDTDSFYKASDIFILSSHFEGFPNVILEAMKFGLPVISTDCKSGPREIFKIQEEFTFSKIILTDYGVLIKENDIDSMVKAINNMTSAPMIYSNISKKALIRVRDFEENQSLEKLNTLLGFDEEV